MRIKNVAGIALHCIFIINVHTVVLFYTTLFGGFEKNILCSDFINAFVAHIVLGAAPALQLYKEVPLGFYCDVLTV